MESKIAVFLIQYLLETGMQSKKVLATEIEIPYRTLLKVHAGKGDKQNSTTVTNHILRYCIKEKIELEAAMEQFH